MAWSDFTEVAILPIAGDNTATATPTASGSADLVSAATNTGGIWITGVSLSVNSDGATTPPHTSFIQIKTGGDIALEAHLVTWHVEHHEIALGSFVALEVPAGDAISYTADKGGVDNVAFFARVTWRHK